MLCNDQYDIPITTIQTRGDKHASNQNESKQNCHSDDVDMLKFADRYQLHFEVLHCGWEWEVVSIIAGFQLAVDSKYFWESGGILIVSTSQKEGGGIN